MIPPIKRILYATDLSKNSVYAYYYAVDLAKKHDAEIVILNVIEPISAKAYGSGKDKLERDQHRTSVEVIQNRILTFCERVGQRNEAACTVLIAKISVQIGEPVEEILKAVDDERCDMIVLGKHGKGFLAKVLLGSVSRAVLDRARKPVFLIPLPSDDTAAWDEI